MKPAELYRLRSRLSGRDRALLDDLRRFRLLTTRQLQRLHFVVPDHHVTTSGATRAAGRALQRLLRLGLVSPLARRVGGAERGSAGALWQLTDSGHQVLAAGSDGRRRMREPSSALFVAHTAAVADLAVRITELCRADGFELIELLSEPDSWRRFVGHRGALEHVRPDLVTVTADRDWQQTTFFEVDLATEHGPQLRRKAELYGRYSRLGAAERDFGVTPRVVWVAPDATRAGFMAKSLPPLDPAADLHAIIVTPESAARAAVITLGDPGPRSDAKEPVP